MKKIVGLLIVLFLFPLTTSAQDFCKGNFDYDDNVDGSDASIFKENFGRGSYENPCPPDGPAPVPRTGQSHSYNPRDDGHYQRGVVWPHPRFANNGDGTVTDNLTGLIWLRDANCSLFNAPRTWYDSINIIIPQLEDGFCQLTDGSSPCDWRLPNRSELLSLHHMGNHPPLPSEHPFTNVVDDNYWSSTTWRISDGTAWYVDMDDGIVHILSKSEARYIWPVRGGRGVSIN